jgi:hypothetical protein
MVRHHVLSCSHCTGCVMMDQPLALSEPLFSKLVWSQPQPWALRLFGRSFR